MRQITIRQLVRQASRANIEAWLPCEVTSDGEVIAVLTFPDDVRQTMQVSSQLTQNVRQANTKAPKQRTMSDKPIPGSYSKEYQLRRR